MWILWKISEDRAQARNLRAREVLLEQLSNWVITKAQYDVEIERLNLQERREKFNKGRLTVWKVAIWTTTGLFKIFVNLALMPVWIKPFKWKNK
jgi:hypothetical protein